MLRVYFRRSTRSRLFRAILLTLAVFCSIDLLSLISSRNQQQIKKKVSPDIRKHKIFIASIHWNNERILRSNWNLAVLDLVEYFGKENVYISVYESGSWDESKNALRVLDQDLERLGVERTITLDETTHADELQKPITDGWVETPRGKKELRRIPYLSRLRNMVLEPLNERGPHRSKFDKVLFLNDVVFTVSLASSLLDSQLTPSIDRRCDQPTHDTRR